MKTAKHKSKHIITSTQISGSGANNNANTMLNAKSEKSSLNDLNFFFINPPIRPL